MPKSQSTQPSQNRHFGAALPASLGRNVKKWAVIVGISQYKDVRLNLNFAARDAEALGTLIQTAAGGDFAPNQVRQLIDEAATTANLIDALRNFLQEPDEDDLVLLYFACHGGPDPRRPNVVYLLTHDTDPGNIAGTALRMDEIERSLRDYLLAKRVIIIADTCHSGWIGGGARRSDQPGGNYQPLPGRSEQIQSQRRPLHIGGG